MKKCIIRMKNLSSNNLTYFCSAYLKIFIDKKMLQLAKDFFVNRLFIVEQFILAKRYKLIY